MLHNNSVKKEKESNNEISNHYLVNIILYENNKNIRKNQWSTLKIKIMRFRFYI